MRKKIKEMANFGVYLASGFFTINIQHCLNKRLENSAKWSKTHSFSLGCDFY